MNKNVYVCNDVMSNDMNESVLIVMRRLLPVVVLKYTVFLFVMTCVSAPIV
jgi:hypothetical protein